MYIIELTSPSLAPSPKSFKPFTVEAHLLNNIQFVLYKCFQFQQLITFVVWQRGKITTSEVVTTMSQSTQAGSTIKPMQKRFAFSK